LGYWFLRIAMLNAADVRIRIAVLRSTTYNRISGKDKA
jgi:hypothetical protein